MWSVVAVKSRTFPGFPHSADEQLWLGLGGSMVRLLATPGNRNISYHGQHAQFISGSCPGDRELAIFLIFWEFKFLHEFLKIHDFVVPQSLLGD